MRGIETIVQGVRGEAPRHQGPLHEEHIAPNNNTGTKGKGLAVDKQLTEEEIDELLNKGEDDEFNFQVNDGKDKGGSSTVIDKPRGGVHI